MTNFQYIRVLSCTNIPYLETGISVTSKKGKSIVFGATRTFRLVRKITIYLRLRVTHKAKKKLKNDESLKVVSNVSFGIFGWEKVSFQL